MTDGYTVAAVRRLLAEDHRITEQAIRVEQHGEELLLCGEVESAERREQIEAAVLRAFPDVRVHCDIGVPGTHPPHGTEVLS
ncbi:hypothetical protein AB0M43_02285 [Longispora sp. NPDC051575]|uniref:hypothetical protein n=1 Tax=Longispora sp. NPDC051575 TaxID=3154943 RepID=UPI0034474812